MKHWKLVCSAALIIGAGCKSLVDDNTLSFIQGTYVKSINTEFTSGMDTIIISIHDNQSATYSIIRKTSYQQKIDGKVLSPKSEIHKWIGVYLPDTRQLKEQTEGRYFSFAPDKGTLTTGSSEYLKISNQ
jgi:hypothetical protein